MLERWTDYAERERVSLKKSVWQKVKVLLFVITNQFKNIQLTWEMLLSLKISNTVANATNLT